jgi:hypothetical protein
MREKKWHCVWVRLVLRRLELWFIKSSDRPFLRLTAKQIRKVLTCAALPFAANGPRSGSENKLFITLFYDDKLQYMIGSASHSFQSISCLDLEPLMTQLLQEISLVSVGSGFTSYEGIEKSLLRMPNWILMLFCHYFGHVQVDTLVFLEFKTRNVLNNVLVVLRVINTKYRGVTNFLAHFARLERTPL